MEAVAVRISPQLSCFSSYNRNNKLQLLGCSKVSIMTSMKVGRGTERSRFVSYSVDSGKLMTEGSKEVYPILEEEAADEVELNEPSTIQESSITPKPLKGAAKIHDFCFGIPYGALVLSGGLIGFLFSRNLATLSTGVLAGGSLLVLSTLSLKIWRQGKSSIPFILGQAVLSAALLWKSMKAYSLTKKLIPTGFYAVVSAAMLLFYSYVVISGGNPPSKKLKAAATVTTS